MSKNKDVVEYQPLRLKNGELSKEHYQFIYYPEREKDIVDEITYQIENVKLEEARKGFKELHELQNSKTLTHEEAAKLMLPVIRDLEDNAFTQIALTEPGYEDVKKRFVEFENNRNNRSYEIKENMSFLEKIKYSLGLDDDKEVEKLRIEEVQNPKGLSY